jgi:soluble lytic murein transglycosylase-like protein
MGFPKLGTTNQSSFSIGGSGNNANSWAILPEEKDEPVQPAVLSPDLDKKISEAAAKYDLDESLFRSVLEQESGTKQIDPKTGTTITSSAGALGIGQLMPSTAEGLGVDPHDIDQNILGSAKYLKSMIDQLISQRLRLISRALCRG